MSLTLVALAGRAGAGKDTAADHLAQCFCFNKIAFADTLRNVCKEAFGLTDAELHDRHLKALPLARWPFQAPVEILQTVGTDLFRRQYPGIWVRRAMEKAHAFDRAVLSDCRFPDEAMAVRGEGGIVIRITRPGHDEGRRPHESETHIDNLDADFDVLNDGTVEDLHAKIGKIMFDLGIYPGGDCYIPPAIR